RAAQRLGAVHRRGAALDQPERAPLVEALGDLGVQRAGGDRRDNAIGRPEAELLGDLVGQGLGALGVVRAHVDVHERPALVLAADLGAQPVDVSGEHESWAFVNVNMRPYYAEGSKTL